MYELYARKYAEQDTPACQFLDREASHATLTLHYYVWLILGGPDSILVNTEFLDDEAHTARSTGRPFGALVGSGRHLVPISRPVEAN